MRAAVVLLLLAGCPNVPPMVIVPDSPSASCPDQPSPKSSDLCDGAFTEGTLIPCAKCSYGGCWDAKRGVYCVEKGSCSDARCSHAK